MLHGAHLKSAEYMQNSNPLPRSRLECVIYVSLYFPTYWGCLAKTLQWKRRLRVGGRVVLSGDGVLIYWGHQFHFFLFHTIAQYHNTHNILNNYLLFHTMPGDKCNQPSPSWKPGTEGETNVCPFPESWRNCMIGEN